MKVYLTTLGCRLNQAEVENFSEQFSRAGFGLTEEPGQADVQVVHTCTVTQVADRKSRQLIRRVKSLNPEAITVVSGCYAETSPGQLLGLPEVNLLVGQQDKPRLVQIVSGLVGPHSPLDDGLMPHPLPLPALRTRAFIKVQDGCNDFCTYCIIPYSRGRVTSRPADEIIQDIQFKLDRGFHEVVLTGVSIGAYGQDRGPKRATTNLVSLVRRILNETPVRRLRISSLEPHDFDPDLAELFQDQRLCNHLHLCLQSGSDGVLRRMRRRYTTAEYAAILEGMRAVSPGIALTTDVIVGFPGETDTEFEETAAFIELMRFTDLHVFRYSPRVGTRAAEFDGQVSESVKKARSEVLIALGERLGTEFRAAQIGTRRPVLFEHPEPGHNGTTWTGLTDNYLRTVVEDSRKLVGGTYTVHIDRATGTVLEGHLVEEAA